MTILEEAKKQLSEKWIKELHRILKMRQSLLA